MKSKNFKVLLPSYSVLFSLYGMCVCVCVYVCAFNSWDPLDLLSEHLNFVDHTQKTKYIRTDFLVTNIQSQWRKSQQTLINRK